MSQVSTEHVLVVPTELFHELGYFQGFCDEPRKYFEALLHSDRVSYRPRGEMEDDPSFKQLIPYCLFVVHDSGQGPLLFQYTRGKGQGEKRLHAKKSVGVGGHISSDDDSDQHAGSPYEEGMRRELAEEIDIRCSFTERMVGLINDDETEVGRVHLGVVHLFELASAEVFPREEGIAEAHFAPVRETLANLGDFETWSQIAIRALFADQ